MFAVLITVAAVPVCGLIAWYVTILVVNDRRIPQESKLVPLLSVRCHVRSDPIVGFSSGKNFYSTVPARFTIYGNFVVIKAITGRIYQHEQLVFARKPGLFRERLFINLKSLNNAIEIVGKTASIIPALKMAGYTLLQAS